MQHVIRLGRAEAGHNVDAAAADLLLDRPQRIEQLGIHDGLLVVAPVAQEMVHLYKHRAVVAAVMLEGEVAGFVCMGMVEVNGTIAAIRHRCGNESRGDTRQEEASRCADTKARRPDQCRSKQ